jgi:hypothetical protein
MQTEEEVDMMQTEDDAFARLLAHFDEHGDSTGKLQLGDLVQFLLQLAGRFDQDASTAMTVLQKHPGWPSSASVSADELRAAHRAGAFGELSVALEHALTPAPPRDPSTQNCSHFNMRRSYRTRNRDQLTTLPPPPTGIVGPAAFEELIEPGGISNIGYRIYTEGRHSTGASEMPSRRIGTMVAGNSGRPGGACGFQDGSIRGLHAGHSTQEEDVIANWIISACHNHGQPLTEHHYDGGHALADEIYRTTICGQWGMLNPTGTDALTVQGVDYTRARHGFWYADAWVVDDAVLSAKDVERRDGFRYYHLAQQFPTTLVFVAGPNCGQTPGRPSSTMRRTYNPIMEEDFRLFRDGVKASLYAGLIAMARRGCTVALLAHVSAGIYAGPWRKRIWGEYALIVTELLSEQFEVEGGGGATVPLGCYFERVVLTKLF